MAMNPEVKAEWVKALRSGEYKQANGLLHRFDVDGNGKDGYCCLGVLCELAVNAGAAERYPDGSYGKGEEVSAIDLPESVQRWAGIADVAERHMEIINDLITANDNGQDFAHIAGMIEARL